MWRNNSTAGSIHAKTSWQIAATKWRGNIVQNGGAYTDESALVNQLQCPLVVQCDAKNVRLVVVVFRFLVSNQFCFVVLIPAKSQFPQNTKVVG